MKKIKQLLALCALAFFTTNCSGYLDDIEPRHAIPQSKLSESDMEKLLNGVYAKMEYYTYQLWWNNDIQGENFATGSGATPMLDPCNMSPSNVNSSVNVTSYWRNSFSAINQINFLLEMYQAAENKESNTMKKIGGACYYFRAYAYYRLAAHFGNVPILRQRSEEVIPLSPEADVWKFIEDDLKEARALCTTASSKWYVSLEAVNALAARVALFIDKKADAVSYADAVIANKKYALVNTDMDFSSIFLPESSSTEIIFAYINNTRTSSYIDYAGTVNDTDGSWSYAPDPTLYETLFADDATTSRVGDIRKAATFHPSEANRIIKFSNGVHQLAPNNDYRHTPVMISRISEMYLIKAEASGKEAGAAALHTFLKNRYAQAPTVEEIKALSDVDYQSLILDERRREFYAEGLRWEDIKRTKRYDLLKTLNGRTYLMYYPIPQEEIDIAGAEKYPQNAGY